MSDLVAFLAARLDEDEAAAKAAQLRFPGPWQPADAPESPLPSAVTLYDAQDESLGVIRGGYAAAHIAGHDPARVLREAAAKRMIIHEHEIRDGRCRVCTAVHDGRAKRFRAPCWTLVSLAMIYSDNPGYRPEWAS